VSLDLSIAQVLTDLEAQVKQLEGQEAFHAQQEVFHREQRALRADELESKAFHEAIYAKA
jgi:hypothetical protein